MTDQIAKVKLAEDRAEVQIGSKMFTVSRRDVHNDTFFCPVELMVGAIGS